MHSTSPQVLQPKKLLSALKKPRSPFSTGAASCYRMLEGVASPMRARKSKSNMRITILYVKLLISGKV